MTGQVRVLVYAKAGAEDTPAVEAAYHRISEHLVGTSGLLGNELLRDPTDASSYVVMSLWDSLAAFQAWEESPEHKPATGPLRPFVTGATIFEVAACY
jgi:heme-degrading monooxygenase HmoA